MRLSRLPALPPLSPTARRLIAARFWRSLAQGALYADLSLYLIALHWSGAAIGAVLSGAGLVGAAFGLLVGITSDRLGRKPFLLGYETLCALCGAAAYLSTNPALLAPAIVLAGFGRGANGAAGPFSPAEQAWLAETVDPSVRGFVFSLNSSLGFVGMALGAAFAILPAFWKHALGPAGAYRPLFLLVIFGNLANLGILAFAQAERKPAARPKSPAHEVRRENHFLGRLIAANVVNGLSIGLTGPIMTYWFARRFHVSSLALAPVVAATFLITSVTAVLSGGLTRRANLVQVVLWGRGLGLFVLILLPLMPVFALAALLYVLRSAFNRGTLGARQALVLNAVRDERRGLAASLNAVSAQIPQAAGPAIAGALIGAGWFVTPIYLGAALQGVYLYLYHRFFSNEEAALQRRL